MLAERRDLIGACAALLETTWPDHYGPTGPGFATKDATDRAQTERLPIGLVAIDQTDTLVGTGTLSGPSYGAQSDEAPWITGLCVVEHMHGHGIASQLVQDLCRVATSTGHRQVFATTSQALGLMQRAGFAELRQLNDDHGTWHVLRKTLS
ncbi:Acetyltransferase (GNAT) family protein [Yoonia litorea]|uniref:Acetyltransferase (GNAT) family protein n=1 Tax=Yoonia litorea TaxID=1123755 RepID=A0A1I6MTQ0_9RHOB|nr:Acetyltransferase (GNAT) family protein [Yoonia litorea]